MLAALVPIDRRRAIARGVAMPDRCTGAALFADVTGFSALASRLADELGVKRAAEELLVRINRVHAVLVGRVHAHTGSVIAFAGDSITCWFDDAPLGRETEANGARRAVACGLAMQRVFEGLTAELSVSLKVAVASGGARRFLVGDPKLLTLDALAGDTLIRMARGETLASPGEVVVSQEVLGPAGAIVRAPKDHRGAFVVIEGQREASPETPWPAGGEPAEAALEGWVLGAVAARLKSEPTFADLRAVVPIFAAFEGIDYDGDAAAGEKLDRLVRAVQAALDGAGGALLELTIGDKGSYLYGVVGAPVAQPDAVRRAASAALELRALPPDVAPSPLRVGMAFDRAWSGVVGTPERAAYAVMGDVVNLAARLMQRAAPGQVLVSAPFSAAAPEVGAEPVGELVLKGKTAPVSAFSLRARAAAGAPAGVGGLTFVGRTSELATLDQMVGRAQTGDRSVLFIEASAGMGKSRLAAEMSRRARERGARCLTATGDSVERSSPFRAWRSVFYEILGGDEHATDSVARSLARAVEIVPELGPRLPLLGPILGVELEETELTRWMPDDVRADNTRELAVRLLSTARGAAGAPIVILLDDAHWIDSASWALARRAFQEISGVVVVALGRPRDSADPPRADDEEKLLRADGAVHVVLGGLSEEDTLAVARARLGVASIPERLASFLKTRAAGHPLLADLLTASLRESGDLLVSGERCTLADSFDEAAVDLPGTVEGVIGERLDRLDPQTLATLGHASVLGSRFDEEALAALDASQDPAEAVERLVQRELLERRDGELGFAHALVRDVAYGRLLFATRRELHRAAARHLAARHARDLGPWHVALAYHYLGAEENARAADHFGAAGEAALRAGAFRETTVFLEKALALASPDTPETVLAHHKRRIANAWYRLGNLPRSAEHAEDAVRVFDLEVPKAGARLAKGIALELVTQVAHRVAPRLTISRAPEVDLPALRSAVSLYQNLSELYYLGGMQGPSIYTALRQVNVAERAGPSEELAEAYAVLSIIAGVIGKRALSRRYEGLAEEVVGGLENPRARAMFLHQRSLSAAAYGEFNQVDRDETEAISIFERLGEIGRRRDALGLLGTTQYIASRYADAERTLESLLATRTGDDRFVQEIWGTAWLGAIALVRGRLDEAVRRIEQSITLLDRNTVGLMEISCVGLLGSALLRRGDAEGLRHVDRAFDLIEKAKGRPTGHISLDGYAVVAEAYLDVAEGRAQHGYEPKRAKARAEQACKWLDGFARVFPIARPVACLMRGRLARSRGDERAARRSFAAGLDAAGALGMATEEGRLHLALGAVSEDRERLDSLERARVKLEAVGAELYAAEARKMQ